MVVDSFFIDSIFFTAGVCPGSPKTVHAKCSMTIYFPKTSCVIIRDEIVSRMRGEKGWIDPHNQGTYTLLNTPCEKDDKTCSNEDLEMVEGSRLTGDGKYTDLFNFGFSDYGEGGCEVSACSESQVKSIKDFSTNYCTLRNLYCNSSDGCNIVNSDFLEYSESYSNCLQRTAELCIVEAKVKN